MDLVKNINPRWRYEAFFNPKKYGFEKYVFDQNSKYPKTSKGCLKRFLNRKGRSVDYRCNIPSALYKYQSTLSSEASTYLTSLFFKRRFDLRLSGKINNTTLSPWNLKTVDQIQDKFFVRLIKHLSNFEYDQNIAFAIQLFKSQDTNIIFRYLGYYFFAGVEDKELAKKWKLSVKKIETVRQLFFDFSKFPKDRTVAFAYLRQLEQLDVLQDLDFSHYRRIYDLGELGLRAETDYFNLSIEEKGQVDYYLASSIVSNTLSLKFNIQSKKDAYMYNNVISNFANFAIKKEEVQVMRAKTKHLEASTRKIDNESDLGGNELMLEDEEGLRLLRELSLENQYDDTCRTIDQLV